MNQNQSHYHRDVPGQYPSPPQRPSKKLPWWAWVLIGVFGLPTLLIGGCSALVVAGGLANEAADPAPVTSSSSPEVPVETYDPGIQTPPTEAKPTEAPKPPKPAEQAPSYLPEDGTLLVGKDVKPGTYQTRVIEGDFISSCYWARLDKSDEIIDNDIKTTVGARMTLTVRASDYALEVNCYGAVWKRVR